MILYIDTSDKSQIFIAVLEQNKEIGSTSVEANFRHSENLLPGIDNLLKGLKISLSDIDEIQVVDHGVSFTSLRIGIVTANALGYALGVPVYGIDKNKKKKRGSGKNFYIVNPKYDRDPNITISKKSLL